MMNVLKVVALVLAAVMAIGIAATIIGICWKTVESVIHNGFHLDRMFVDGWNNWWHFVRGLFGMNNATAEKVGTEPTDDFEQKVRVIVENVLEEMIVKEDVITENVIQEIEVKPITVDEIRIVG